MSAGHGGQILISNATRELVRDLLPATVELNDLGEKRLKELLRPVHLYQVNMADLPGTFPPLKTLDLFLNNLPVQLTSFVGRENEIAELKQEVNKHRLVTLTGSGGEDVTVSGHPLTIAPGYPATAAKSKKLNYHDYGSQWEVSERNGFFSPFTYRGD